MERAHIAVACFLLLPRSLAVNSAFQICWILHKREDGVEISCFCLKDPLKQPGIDWQVGYTFFQVDIAQVMLSTVNWNHCDMETVQTIRSHDLTYIITFLQCVDVECEIADKYPCMFWAECFMFEDGARMLALAELIKSLPGIGQCPSSIFVNLQ